jgi:8-oxo-dGTP diphosphatase
MKKTIKVVGCIVRLEDKILLLYRSAKETEPSLWGIPAGKTEEGESELQTVARELYEETGLKLQEKDLEYLGHLPIEYDTFIVDFPIFTVSFDHEPSVILTPREHIDYKWLTPRQVLSLPDLMKDVDVIIQKFCIDKLNMNS